jgi:hypothetical protein
MERSLNPADDEFQKLLAGMNKRIQSLENSRQPYTGDWITLNPSDLQAVSITGAYNNILNMGVPNYNPSDKFNIGDRIHLQQGGGADYYGFVKRFSDTDRTLQIQGDSNLSFVIAAYPFELVEMSKLGKPDGMTDGFRITSTSNAHITNVAATNTAIDLLYYAYPGGRIDVFGSVYTNLTAATNIIRVKGPSFISSPDDIPNSDFPLTINSLFVNQQTNSDVLVTAGGLTDFTFDIQTRSGANFPSGAFSTGLMYVFFDYSYAIVQ